MKTFAIIMIVLTLALGGTVVYALLNTSLQVTAQGFQAAPASSRESEFATLRDALEGGYLTGVAYDADAQLDADACQFYMYTLRLKNNGLVPAEMVEMQISPRSGDVLAYGSGEKVDIAPGATQDVRCMLLTRSQGGTVREMTVTYYLWGHAYTVKYTYEQN